MFDFTPTNQLILVNLCGVFAFLLVGISTIDLVCFFRQKQGCAKLLSRIKVLFASASVALNLALVAAAIFVAGLSHGGAVFSGAFDFFLFIAIGLVPSVFFVAWVYTRLSISAFWVIFIVASFSYIAILHPVSYVRIWADNNYVWAQLWLARNYETGRIGVAQADGQSTAWYKKAALNGSREAQFKFALTRGDLVEARKWYRLAAEQGHVDAMIQAARLLREQQDQLKWLNKAAEADHPDAFYMLARIEIYRDLPEARRLLLDAADKGSRSAIEFLIGQYQAGGALFEQDPESVKQWQAVLARTPVSEIDANRLTAAMARMNAPSTNTPKKTDEAEFLYKQALKYLDHPALDAELKARAVKNLKMAASLGHGDAAYKLGKMEMEKTGSEILNDEALQWYKVAAAADHEYALEAVMDYYKQNPDATIEDLNKSLEYSLQLYNVLVNRERPHPLLRNHIGWEHKDTKEKIARLERLGGSWESAEEDARQDPDAEYRLGLELIEIRQNEKGKAHVEAAAKRGSQAARHDLAKTVLNQPRSFSKEVNALTELQLLDQQGYLPASFTLAGKYRSGNRVYPTNLYLARQLYRKVQADPDLGEQATENLAKIPAYFDALILEGNGNYPAAIDRWYAEIGPSAEDKILLQQQYDSLMEHFRDTKELRQKAQAGDARAQYQLAQSLQNHNLAQAIEWLQKSAAAGHADAQYDLVWRMIYGKRNSPETRRQLVEVAIAAVENNHVAAMIFTANLYREGYGDLPQDNAKAGEYYKMALASSEQDVLYRARHTGQITTYTRSNIQRIVNRLQ